MDGSILVELLSTQKRIRDKKRRRIFQKTRAYIKKVKHAKISIPAFGEVCKTLVEWAEEYFEHAYAFTEIVMLMQQTGMRFNAPQREAYTLGCKIMAHDARIEPQDAMRIAEAIESGADRLITLEKDLVDNEALQKAFEIKIEYPWGNQKII